MIATHICPHCSAFLVAMDAADMVLLRETHNCAAKQDRNQLLAWGVPMTAPLSNDAIQAWWLANVTVEDARLLHSLGIDPL